MSQFFDSIVELYNQWTANLYDIWQLQDKEGVLFTAVARWVFIFLAAYILIRCFLSLLFSKNPSEVWAYFHIGGRHDTDEEINLPITHWENVVGRGKASDISIDDLGVSRTHGTLCRDNEGEWSYMDFGSTNGAEINGRTVFPNSPVKVGFGDELKLGMRECTLFPISLEEKNNNRAMRMEDTMFSSPWSILIALTIFQVLTLMQLKIALGDKFQPNIVIAFVGMIAIVWGYVIFMKGLKRKAFEMEFIAFFLSTLSLAVTATKYPGSVFKQFLAIALGFALFFVMCIYLRDLSRVRKLKPYLIILSAVLLLINLVFAKLTYGARNWISIGGFSVQPSELVKLAYIWIGAGSLNYLVNKKDNFRFMAFSAFCFICLALMNDFGTAIIFFVSFLIISFLRTGDFTKLIVVVGVAFVGGLMVLKFKSYVAARFATWGHVWEYADSSGFQQTRALSATASGGLVGVGAGKGWLNEIPASDTDMVFPLISEEWGVIIATLAVLAIIMLSIFAVRSVLAGRSTFYTIAACSATSMFLFQTGLNVFGSVDILPFTGVTFPFVSNGGTSMIACWGLLAFLKAADTRQNASFAISLKDKDVDSVESDNYVKIDDIEHTDEDDLFAREEKSVHHVENSDRNKSNSNISSEKDGINIGHESQTSYTEDELEALANGEFLGGDDSK